MAPWVLLRHELADGSWHFDWMLAAGGADAAHPLTTFRVTQRPDEPGTLRFDAERIGDHRREYLTYEGPVPGGRGNVRRVTGGTCRIDADDWIFVVSLTEAGRTWIGTRGDDGRRYTFELHADPVAR